MFVCLDKDLEDCRMVPMTTVKSMCGVHQVDCTNYNVVSE